MTYRGKAGTTPGASAGEKLQGLAVRGKHPAKCTRPLPAYATGLLKQFPVNLMRMQEVQRELMFLRKDCDVRAQSYNHNPCMGWGDHGDPVVRLADRKFALEHLIDLLEERVVPVMRLRNSLKNSGNEDERVRFYIMELHYFEEVSLPDVMIHLGKRNIGYMRRQKRELLEGLMEEVEKFSKTR